MSKIQDYIDFVEALATEGENKIFFNSGPLHAAAVMSTIFKHANKNVKIFAGDFSGAVSNREIYLSQLNNYLARPDTNLEIILQNDSNIHKSKIFDVLRGKRNVKLTQSPFKVTRRVLEDDVPVHFTVADGKMFRIETDVDNFYAECNFNDVEKASQLTSLFDNLMNSDKCKEIVLP